VYWTRKNEAENAEFSKITSRKQNLKAARNEKLSSRRSANSPMPSGCAIPILKPGVFQQNRYCKVNASFFETTWQCRAIGLASLHHIQEPPCGAEPLFFGLDSILARFA